MVLAVAVAGVTLGSTLGGGSPTQIATGPTGPRALLPSGPPAKQKLAREQGLVLYVPIEQDLITAIAFHGVAQGNAFPLSPVGRQVNAGVIQRLWDRVFGDGSGGLRYYVSDGSTDAVDVGARAGTDVYAPVSGRVVSLVPEILDMHQYGVTVGIQPTTNPSVVVDVSHVRPGTGPKGLPSVNVGEPVQAAQTHLGTVADLSGVIQSELRHYVSDAGNGAAIEVDPAPVPAVP